MSYFNIYMEELLDGFAGTRFAKVNIRRVENRAEFDNILKNATEPRGVITGGDDPQLYLSTTDSWDVVHSDIIAYLYRKNLMPSCGQDIEDGDEDFDRALGRFLTVQCQRGKLYIGESYGLRTMDGPNIKKNPDMKVYINAMKKLNIPFVLRCI